MRATVFSDTVCTLGEGPLWHPEEQVLYWFDILGKRLYRRGETGEESHWQFEEHVSAAGWIDRGALLVVSETAFFRFDTETGESGFLAALEADNPATRSNDGRADPWGGFWVGTMGKSAEPGAGAIYRYYHGKVTRLFSDITIPNSICFAPDRSTAYFADTPKRRIMAVALDREGFPCARPRIAVDLVSEALNPDGSVIDASGNLWNAQWGAGRVACYNPEGTFLRALELGGKHASCPAFGGAGMDRLFVTTATEHMQTPTPRDGLLYVMPAGARGLPEYRVLP